MLYYGARDPFDRSEAIGMSNNSGSDILERMEVRELVEKWVLYRDAADWENFRSLWADDGRKVKHGPQRRFGHGERHYRGRMVVDDGLYVVSGLVDPTVNSSL